MNRNGIGAAGVHGGRPEIIGRKWDMTKWARTPWWWCKGPERQVWIELGTAMGGQDGG